MPRRSASPTITHTKDTAETRFHELVDELKLLTVAFPHLKDAVGTDDLPVSFLLKRGADRADARVRRARRAIATPPAVGVRKKKT